MWNAYKYMFYWLYTWQKSLWGITNGPHHSAIMGLSTSFICNSVSLTILLDLYLEINLFPNGISKLVSLIYSIMVLGIHYLFFIHKNQYLEIEKKYEVESLIKRRLKGLLVMLYVFGSIVFLITIAFVGIGIKANKI